MSLSLSHLPVDVVDACLVLQRELTTILGDDLVALWLHGGTTFSDRPLVPGDLDVAGVVTGLSAAERDPDRWLQRDPATRPARVHALLERIAADHGRAVDATWIAREDAGADTMPRAAFDRRPCHTWAVLRSHWLAGQYVHLHGTHPADLVVAPAPAALACELDRELEHLERHVHEGDAADPYEATYAIFNGCRVMRTVLTDDAVCSKRTAGGWGLEHLDPVWHAAIRAAGRSYDGVADAADVALLEHTVPAFVAMVREHVPVVDPRPDGPPRWS